MSTRLSRLQRTWLHPTWVATCSLGLFSCGDHWEHWSDFYDRRGGPPGGGYGSGSAHEDAAPASDAGSETPAFELRVVTAGLFQPYEITWGPDDTLWVSERVGRRLLRLDPATGARFPLVTVDDAIQTAAQDGVMGFALHPELLQGSGNDYVYVAYTYDADPGPALDRRVKIRRYTYDVETQSLGAPVDLITGLVGSDFHNSGRLVFGPDSRLYYTIGDEGGNQFEKKCLPIRSQQLPTQEQVDASDYSAYVGKVLRLELDGSIPPDNPVLRGVRSHVYSYGHRNAQGLAFGPHGKLYSNEHGPKSDDELNWIRKGKNYGWPNVSGYRDNAAYEYANWSASSPIPCEALEFDDYSIPESVPVELETEFRDRRFMPPIATYYTVPSDYEFVDPACTLLDYMCWPTVAPSSLDYYPRSGAIPGWGNSLLFTSLKAGQVFRVRLSADGRRVIGPTQSYFETTNRYRDLAIAPDTRTFYVVTDNEGVAQTPTPGDTNQLEHPGAVLEFRFVGDE